MRRREQTFRRERYLEPREALRRLLRNSSFVRQPTVVVRRTAMEQEGLFDTTVGDATDNAMWVRLFSRYGVRCLPQATCAYTIHEAAATTGMWHPGTIRANGEIFDRAVARGIVPERTIRRWQADWYHQFILAGAYRRLRMGRRAEAREVLRLFELPEVHDRGVSPKWLPVRAAFTAATAGRARRRIDGTAGSGDISVYCSTAGIGGRGGREEGDAMDRPSHPVGPLLQRQFWTLASVLRWPPLTSINKRRGRASSPSCCEAPSRPMATRSRSAQDRTARRAGLQPT